MATYNIGELVWKVTGDSSGAVKELDKAEKKATKTASLFQKLGPLIKAGIGLAVLDVGKKFVNAASDAEETANKFGVVFSGISDQANATANSLARDFGLSSTAARRLLSDTGDLLTGFGFTQAEALSVSNQVNELAVDLASFTNIEGGAERASAALTSALLGEREAIKSLGIAITDADLKQFAEDQGLVFNELGRQEKAYLTLRLAQQQSLNAQGDFARSSDSFANQIRILEANIEDLSVAIGNIFLPVINAVATAINQLFRNLDTWQDAFDTTLEDRVNRLDTLQRKRDQLLKRSEEASRQGATSAVRELQKEISAIDKRIDAEEETINAINKRVKVQASVVMGASTVSDAIEDQTRKLADNKKAWDDLSDTDKFEIIASGVSTITSGIISSIQALDSLNKQISDNRLARLDEEEHRTLESAGLAEQTERERLQEELQAAIAANDQALVADKRKALQKLEIEEDFAKRRAKLEYDGALSSWELQRAAAAIQLASAPLNAYVSTLAIQGIGPAIAPAAAALAAATAALQFAQVQAARPEPPKFQEGGVVPGTSFTGDQVDAKVNSGERILNMGQQEFLMEASRPQRVIINIGTETIFDQLLTASQNGELIIDARAVRSNT